VRAGFILRLPANEHDGFSEVETFREVFELVQHCTGTGDDAGEMHASVSQKRAGADERVDAFFGLEPSGGEDHAAGLAGAEAEVAERHAVVDEGDLACRDAAVGDGLGGALRAGGDALGCAQTPVDGVG